jgi:anaerobic selenocysteine-containing dehydrogenase
MNVCGSGRLGRVENLRVVVKGTVTLEEFDDPELLICIGHNPRTNHPRCATAQWSAARRRDRRAQSFENAHRSGSKRRTLPSRW